MKRLEGRPFAILGVNSDEDRVALKEVLVQESITWRSWWDGGDTSGPIATQWNVTGWPTVYLLDHKGVVRYRYLRDEALDQAIEKLVNEATER